MTNAQDVIRQKLALLQEAEIALYSVEAGLAHLENNRPYAPKPYYFLWFILLATGFERLMKIIVCMHEFETSGVFPTKKFLKNISHDLLALRDEVVSRCYPPEYLQRPFGQADQLLLTTDPLLELLLNALNDFAKEDRYMFMDRISNPIIGREEPKRRWDEIERIALALPDDAYFQLLNDDYPALKHRANIATKAHIERFARALTRLFLFSNLGNLARSQYALIAAFMRIEDSELGRKTYQI